ncbi:reverse transcriptase domain-containing protein, partial [Tanacetum coccineum]
KACCDYHGQSSEEFVWDNIVCKFGLPGEIVSDNGKQFRDNPFKDWCEKLCIRQCFASVKHPQANGLVERVNRSLGEGVKARLDERSKDWIGKLSHVLWAHRTRIKSSNGETPFSLTYDTEAIILAEIGILTLRTAEVRQQHSPRPRPCLLQYSPQQKEGPKKYWLHPPKSGKTEAWKLSPSLVGEEPQHASWLP